MTQDFLSIVSLSVISIEYWGIQSNILKECYQDLKYIPEEDWDKHWEILEGTNHSNAYKIKKSQLQNILNQIKDKLKISAIEFYVPLRIGLSAEKNCPPIAEVLFALGKQESLRRIDNYIKYLKETIIDKIKNDPDLVYWLDLDWKKFYSKTDLYEIYEERCKLIK